MCAHSFRRLFVYSPSSRIDFHTITRLVGDWGNGMSRLYHFLLVDASKTEHQTNQSVGIPCRWSEFLTLLTGFCYSLRLHRATFFQETNSVRTRKVFNAPAGLLLQRLPLLFFSGRLIINSQLSFIPYWCCSNIEK